MSEPNTDPSTDGAQRAASPAPSEKSIKSDVSTASSRLPKPTGIRPPAATIMKPSTSINATNATPVTTRIGRLCTAHGHGAKAGPPPLELLKSKYYFLTSIFCFVFFFYQNTCYPADRRRR